MFIRTCHFARFKSLITLPSVYSCCFALYNSEKLKSPLFVTTSTQNPDSGLGEIVNPVSGNLQQHRLRCKYEWNE